MIRQSLVIFALALGLLLLVRRGKQILRLISPNYAVVMVEGHFHIRRRIVLRVRTPMIAAQWAGDPPRLDLRGLEGLAWLTDHGCVEAREYIFLSSSAGTRQLP